MNTRGQLDMIISLLVVFFIVFFIMAVFLFVSITAGQIRGKANFISSSVGQDDFLTKLVTVNDKDMMVVEAIARRWRNELTRRELINSLEPLVSDSTCLYMRHGIDNSPDQRLGDDNQYLRYDDIILVTENGEVFEQVLTGTVHGITSDDLFRHYYRTNRFDRVAVEMTEGETLYVDYNLGGCR